MSSQSPIPHNKKDVGLERTLSDCRARVGRSTTIIWDKHRFVWGCAYYQAAGSDRAAHRTLTSAGARGL